MPAGALLAGCFISTFVGGWPMLISFPIVILSIYVVAQMLP